jgi:hypothetical protein
MVFGATYIGILDIAMALNHMAHGGATRPPNIAIDGSAAGRRGNTYRHEYFACVFLVIRSPFGGRFSLLHRRYRHGYTKEAIEEEASQQKSGADEDRQEKDEGR